jgi:outer membrane protein assembly factor BamA
MGNENSLRGFSTGGLGGPSYNNRLLLSWEYRIPIWELPKMSFPWLAWYDNNLNNFNMRIDGGIFVDYGYIWEKLAYPISIYKNQQGASAGVGLRFMFPALKRSVCADLSFPFVFPYKYFNGEFPWAIHLYLDLPF